MKSVGLYGGTFDPVHIGHLITVRNVFETRDLEKIIFMPSFIAPHKIGIESSDAEHRINMLKLSIQNFNEFEISDYEIVKDDVSYSVDTLKFLKLKYEQIELIIGYDNYLIFHTWKDYQEIFDLCKVIVMKRVSDITEPEHNLKANFEFVDSPRIDISSSEIRERIRNNLPVDYLIPEPVKKYIETHKLYI